MARPLRMQYPGAVYHVTLRGNARQPIFRDERDHESFLRRLGETVESYQVRLYTFCLMANHAHLVLETPGANLSRFMHSLSGGYATYFNRRHGWVGHLSQGRYGAGLVEADEYLHRLSRYVHLNPLSAQGTGGGVSAICGEWAGAHGRGVSGGTTGSSAAHWGEGFRLWVDGLYGQLVAGWQKKEDVAFRRVGERVKAETILKRVGAVFECRPAEVCRRRRGTWVRAVAVRVLVQHGGLTQREAAAVLGLGTGAAVSIQLRRLAERLAADNELRRKSAKIETTLGK